MANGKICRECNDRNGWIVNLLLDFQVSDSFLSSLVKVKIGTPMWPKSRLFPVNNQFSGLTILSIQSIKRSLYVSKIGLKRQWFYPQ